MQYAGVSMTLYPGELEMFEINCAKHLLNAYGARGLTSIPHGGDEEKLKSDGKRRNEEFKRKQVTEYNIRNENRKNMGMGYLPPTKKMREYALELGLELMEPYAPRDTERLKLGDMERKNIELEKSNKELNKRITDILTKFEKVMGEKLEDPKGRGNPAFKKQGEKDGDIPE